MIHAQNPHTIVLEPYLQNHFCKRHVPEAGFLSEIAPHVLFSSSPLSYARKTSAYLIFIIFEISDRVKRDFLIVRTLPQTVSWISLPVRLYL